jgi:F-type H+-transporting ATPase subunit a
MHFYQKKGYISVPKMMNLYSIISSPLDQFEIRNLLSLDVPVLGNLHLSITNIGLYLTVGMLIALTLNVLATNYNKIVSNNWSISQESIYATIYNIVVSQINASKGQIYFPFIFALFIFILVNNLIGMVPYSFASTSHFILTFSISFTIVLGATILGFKKHGFKFFSLFVPAGTPIGLLPLLVLIEFISYVSRAISLGLRLAANLTSGHILLNILSFFTFQIMTSGLIFFFIGLIPLAFIFAFSILELVICLVQAQVFVILTASYIKDALFLHSDSSTKTGLVEKKPLNLSHIKKQQSVVSGLRYYSTRSSRSVKLSIFKPAAIYANAEQSKKIVMQENQGKSGVYRWTNLINGKTYIGSSYSLSNRLRHYYSKKNMEAQLKKGKSAIYSSILKYGVSMFKLEILEYCLPEECIKLEQKHIKLFKPLYNILQIAGSSFGFKHSAETLANMRKKKLSEEHKANISAAQKGKKKPWLNKPKSEEHKLKLTLAQPNCIKIKVTDLETNITTEYDSVKQAARALDLSSPNTIYMFFKQNQKKPYKGRYIFSSCTNTK